MTAIVVIAVVFAAAAGWFALPLVPVLVAITRPKKTDPLSVPSDATRDVRHFALRFRAFLERAFPDEMRDPENAETRAGHLDDGLEFLVVNDLETMHFSEQEEVEATTEKLLLFLKPAVLPERMVFNRELYGRGALRFGDESILRAALGEADVTLGRDVSIARWLHAAGPIRIGSGARLMGRVSSDDSIRMAASAGFERIHAPRIEIGTTGSEFPEDDALPPPSSQASFVELAGKRWVIHGDLEIPPGALVKGSIVVRGDVSVGDGCRIAGSLKSHGDLTLGAAVIVEGALVSKANVVAGEGCMIDGPVIAEDSIALGARTRIGHSAAPTSVTAPKITLEAPAQCFGTLWAREAGEVKGPILAAAPAIDAIDEEVTA